uniref:AB hydrolase-1 domain-containing protein n=1 Tax=Timema tahoe TaxID=61484 RepID=A0A7R9IJM1_9NEOP|nr:unnamed protein product [Timema tahoe]
MMSLKSEVPNQCEGIVVTKCVFAIPNIKITVEPKLVLQEEYSLNHITTQVTRLVLFATTGSIWSDFKPQLEKLNRSKFTLVAWDPPGYGKSRPPDREFSLNFLHHDADIAAKLMQSLGLNMFSLLGWSDGGITAMILAAKHPQNVDRMLIWGANAYIVKEELKIYESIRDVSKWSERMRAPLVALYGEEYFQNTWSRWVDTFVSLYRERQGDICKDCLPLIQCRTLIAHGMKDPMIAPEHLNYLLKHIKASSRTGESLGPGEQHSRGGIVCHTAGRGRCSKVTRRAVTHRTARRRRHPSVLIVLQ